MIFSTHFHFYHIFIFVACNPPIFMVDIYRYQFFAWDILKICIRHHRQMMATILTVKYCRICIAFIFQLCDDIFMHIYFVVHSSGRFDILILKRASIFCPFFVLFLFVSKIEMTKITNDFIWLMPKRQYFTRIYLFPMSRQHCMSRYWVSDWPYKFLSCLVASIYIQWTCEQCFNVCRTKKKKK